MIENARHLAVFCYLFWYSLFYDLSASCSSTLCTSLRIALACKRDRNRYVGCSLFHFTIYPFALSFSLSLTHTHAVFLLHSVSLSLALPLSFFFSSHTHTHKHTHTHTQTHTPPPTHTHTHTPKHTYAHTYTCTNTRACKNIRVQYVRTHTRTTYMRIFLTRVLFVNARLFDTHLFHVCFFVFPIRPFSIRYSTHENGYIT